MGVSQNCGAHFETHGVRFGVRFETHFGVFSSRMGLLAFLDPLPPAYGRRGRTGRAEGGGTGILEELG